jgi:Glutamyl- and glutaminyl-tRNA synthetases
MICVGRLCRNPKLQCGDFPIRDREGQWTYQFAVCVDDIDEGITHIVRGEDIRSSTAAKLPTGSVGSHGTPHLPSPRPDIRQFRQETLQKGTRLQPPARTRIGNNPRNFTRKSVLQGQNARNSGPACTGPSDFINRILHISHSAQKKLYSRYGSSVTVIHDYENPSRSCAF